MKVNIELAKQPDNKASVLHYCPIKKYSDWVQEGKVTLSQISKWRDDDRFEGASTIRNREMRSEVYREDDIPLSVINNVLPAVFEVYPNWCYGSCWSVNDSESNLMWDRYAKDGVLIRSSYERLISVVSKNIDQNPNALHIGLVEYINDNFYMPENHLYRRLFFKRETYQQENELRLMWQPVMPMRNGKFDPFLKNTTSRVDLFLNLEELIEEIIISPYGGDGLLKQVSEITRNAAGLEMEKKIKPSVLSAELFY